MGTLEKAPAKDISSFKLEGVVRNGFLQWQLPRSWFIWVSITQLCPTFFDPTDCGPPGSSVHGDYPGNNTGMGCHFFLQGIFPTQGSNPHLLHCRWILYHSATWETSPKVLEHRLNSCALAQAQLLGLSCSKACEIFLDQGSNLYLLHWQEDSLPLSHRGSPMLVLFCELP